MIMTSVWQVYWLAHVQAAPATHHHTVTTLQ